MMQNLEMECTDEKIILRKRNLQGVPGGVHTHEHTVSLPHPYRESAHTQTRGTLITRIYENKEE